MSNRIEDRLKAGARGLSFDLAGIARATEADGFARYRDWLARGYAGEMEYLHRNAEPRRHPDSIVTGVRSVLMVGMTYGPPGCEATTEHEPTPRRAVPVAEIGPGGVSGGSTRSDNGWVAAEGLPALTPPGSPLTEPTALCGFEQSSAAQLAGRVARYAQAPDYHNVLWDKLNALAAWLDAEVPGARSHGVADTAPLLERDFARRAGLGWIGKNTMLLNKERGSYFLLGALLTTAELEPDPPTQVGHCGTCTACLDACPTGAFVEPGSLDARRCISYLTIEHRTAVPDELRPPMGDWLFGCDVCQEVCPWNHRKTGTPGLPHRPDLVAIDAVELLGMAPDELRRRFKGTALRRANWRGLLRNAAIVLGNGLDRRALPALRGALKWDDDVVREACEWAIARIEESGAKS